VGGDVRALAVLPNGDLVAGGLFTTAGGQPANRIARWNGSAWSPLGSGMNNAVNALAMLPNGDLVAGGDFLTAGGVVAPYLARWGCPPPTACNPADITGIGGPPSAPDGLLTGDDFNAFISAFAASEMRADITGIGGPPALPDGLLTGDDFNAFIAAFAQGCP
jgi:hypothetical protein